MALEFVGVCRGPPIEARPEDPGAHQGRPTARHVDDSGAGEIDDARQHSVGVGGGEEALAVPDPVDDDRVDEA